MKTAAFAGLLTLSGGTPTFAERVTVFAAASLQEALEATATQFSRETEHEVVLSFAASSALARQIEYGAPADVFLSANVKWMQYLLDSGLVDPSGEKLLFGNRLSLVVPVESSMMERAQGLPELLELLKDRKLAMALVDAVPAGIYGKQALQSLGVWGELQSNIVQTDNVRAALALVALGEVAAGVVYATDAQAEDRVRIVAEFPTKSHDEIVYPAAVLTGRGRSEVIEFMRYLGSDFARRAFVAQGFRILETDQ